MKLEIHILQSFPPANLNRDENGMPKSCTFGGHTRARISSQCQKRAVRLFYHDFYEQFGIDVSHFARRSRGMAAEVQSLLEEGGIESTLAESAAKLTISVLTEKEKKKDKAGKPAKSKKKSQEVPDEENVEDEDAEEAPTKGSLILFLGDTEYRGLASLLLNQWGSIEPSLKSNPAKLPDDIKKRIKSDFEKKGGKPGDVALFGRMMAVLPNANVDAAVQVAHAIGVNALQQEFDFFTAVDDLAASDDTGADHMGETGYNSATYYRFANLDTEQLIKNLGTVEGADRIARAFAEAFVKAIPSGHQNSFAAHSLPALVLMVVRQGQPISLVDAFENPIRPKGGLSLLDRAVENLDRHWEELHKMYGDCGQQYVGVVTRQQLQDKLHHLKDKQEESLDVLIEKAIAEAFDQGGK